MAEGSQGDFKFYLNFTKPLVLGLPELNDRVLAASWVKKLIEVQADEEIKTKYLKLLLFVLQRKKLSGIFLEDPGTFDNLQTFPETNLIDVARKLIEEDNVKRIQEGGDFPPIITDYSSDLLEYVSVQKIPHFGVHAYYALSKDPLPHWDKLDKAIFPKVTDSMLHLISEVPKIPEPPPPNLPTFPHKRKAKVTLGTSPPSTALGQLPPGSDRQPPTWGSNLIEVKEKLKDEMDVIAEEDQKQQQALDDLDDIEKHLTVCERILNEIDKADRKATDLPDELNEEDDDDEDGGPPAGGGGGSDGGPPPPSAPRKQPRDPVTHSLINKAARLVSEGGREETGTRQGTVYLSPQPPQEYAPSSPSGAWDYSPQAGYPSPNLTGSTEGDFTARALVRLQELRRIPSPSPIPACSKEARDVFEDANRSVSIRLPNNVNMDDATFFDTQEMPFDLEEDVSDMDIMPPPKRTPSLENLMAIYNNAANLRKTSPALSGAQPVTVPKPMVCPSRPCSTPATPKLIYLDESPPELTNIELSPVRSRGTIPKRQIPKAGGSKRPSSAEAEGQSRLPRPPSGGGQSKLSKRPSSAAAAGKRSQMPQKQSIKDAVKMAEEQCACMPPSGRLEARTPQEVISGGQMLTSTPYPAQFPPLSSSFDIGIPVDLGMEETPPLADDRDLIEFSPNPSPGWQQHVRQQPRMPYLVEYKPTVAAGMAQIPRRSRGSDRLLCLREHPDEALHPDDIALREELRHRERVTDRRPIQMPGRQQLQRRSMPPDLSPIQEPIEYTSPEEYYRVDANPDERRRRISSQLRRRCIDFDQPERYAESTRIDAASPYDDCRGLQNILQRQPTQQERSLLEESPVDLNMCIRTPEMPQFTIQSPTPPGSNRCSSPHPLQPPLGYSPHTPRQYDTLPPCGRHPDMVLSGERPPELVTPVTPDSPYSRPETMSQIMEEVRRAPRQSPRAMVLENYGRIEQLPRFYKYSARPKLTNIEEVSPPPRRREPGFEDFPSPDSNECMCGDDNLLDNSVPANLPSPLSPQRPAGVGRLPEGRQRPPNSGPSMKGRAVSMAEARMFAAATSTPAMFQDEQAPPCIASPPSPITTADVQYMADRQYAELMDSPDRASCMPCPPTQGQYERDTYDDDNRLIRQEIQRAPGQIERRPMQVRVGGANRPLQRRSQPPDLSTVREEPIVYPDTPTGRHGQNARRQIRPRQIDFDEACPCSLPWPTGMDAPSAPTAPLRYEDYPKSGPVDPYGISPVRDMRDVTNIADVGGLSLADISPVDYGGSPEESYALPYRELIYSGEPDDSGMYLPHTPQRPTLSAPRSCSPRPQSLRPSPQQQPPSMGSCYPSDDVPYSPFESPEFDPNLACYISDTFEQRELRNVSPQLASTPPSSPTSQYIVNQLLGLVNLLDNQPQDTTRFDRAFNLIDQLNEAMLDITGIPEEVTRINGNSPVTEPNSLCTPCSASSPAPGPSFTERVQQHQYTEQYGDQERKLMSRPVPGRRSPQVSTIHERLDGPKPAEPPCCCAKPEPPQPKPNAACLQCVCSDESSGSEEESSDENACICGREEGGGFSSQPESTDSTDTMGGNPTDRGCCCSKK